MNFGISIIEPVRHLDFRAVGKRLSQLREKAVLVFVYRGVKYRIVIHLGDIIDGASIPRLCWTATGLTPHGVLDTPALFHDMSYRHQGKMPKHMYQYQDENGDWVDCSDHMPRWFADALLYELSIHLKGISDRSAFIIWSGVRLGGWWPWMRDDHSRMIKVIQKNFTG